MFKTTTKLLTALTFGIFLVNGGAVFANFEKCAATCWAEGTKCQQECQQEDADCRIECFIKTADCITECEDEFPADYNKIKSKLSKARKK